MKQISGGVAPYMMGLVLGVAVVSTVSANQARQKNIDNQTKYIEKKKKYLQKMANSMSTSYVLEKNKSNSTGQRLKANHQVYTNIFDGDTDLAVKEGRQSKGSKINVLTIDKNERKKHLALNRSDSLKKDYSNEFTAVVKEGSTRSIQISESYKNMKKQAEDLYNNLIKTNAKTWPCSIKSTQKDVWGRKFKYTYIDDFNAQLSFKLPWNKKKLKVLNIKLPKIEQDKLAVIKIEGYYKSSYALLSNGDLYVAGDNSYSQLGLPSPETTSNYPWKKSATNVKDIKAAYRYAAILKNNGEVWTTGDNSDGMLANNRTGSRNYGWKKTSITNVKEIYVHNEGIFALNNNNELFVSGDNGNNRLGVPGRVSRLYDWEKVPIDNLKKLNKISSKDKNFYGVYMITQDNKLLVSGTNYPYGSLGTGAVTETKGLIDSGLRDVKDVYLAEPYKNAFVVTNGGDLYVAGSGKDYVLGTGVNTMQDTWYKIPQITDAKSVVTTRNVFEYASYVVTNSGDVWVAGGNGTYWMLGMGGERDSFIKTFTKTPLSNIDRVVVISETAYAITKTGDVWGAGAASKGLLGLGVPVDRQKTWRKLPISNVKDIVINSNSNTYIITNDNKLYTAGYNDSDNMGDLSTSNHRSWLHLMDDVKSVKMIFDASFVIKNNGELHVAGGNEKGHLGLNSSLDVKERTVSIGPDILTPSKCK